MTGQIKQGTMNISRRLLRHKAIKAVAVLQQKHVAIHTKNIQKLCDNYPNCADKNIFFEYFWDPATEMCPCFPTNAPAAKHISKKF